MSATAPPLDLTAPLPPGRLAVQASAGTGKTFALAALATRLVAEQGVAASELLVVTFTRAATAELRARVRDRLVGAARHLAEPDPGEDDELLVHLAGAEREVRRRRLERAVTEFDTATVTTIHGFATQVRATLGATAGTDLDARLVDDGRELVLDACTDVLAEASTQGHDPDDLPSLTTLAKGAFAAVSTPDLLVEPTPDRPGATPGDLLLAQLVTHALAAIRARRRAAGTFSFDDVLLELRRELRGGGSDAVVDALRRRFRVALIDEFQDTDPVQWDIFRTVFGPVRAPGSLVLVGDPKQAIYAFRGANVHTYLDAVEGTGEDRGAEQRSLARSWRSDGALLRALGTLFEGVTFGSDAIAFTPVAPAPGLDERHLLDAAGEPLPALRLRVATDESLRENQDGSLRVPDVERAVYPDLVAQARALLDGARIPDEHSAGGVRRVRPSDLAVLVKTNAEAQELQRALVHEGVPAVLARSGSVLDSPAADAWRWLLDAMGRPSDARRARGFALSWFGGWSPEQVAAASDDALARLQDRLQGWVDVLHHDGTTAFVRAVWSQSGVVPRVLAQPEGDRAITDLGHVADLLQAGAGGEGVSVGGLATLLDADPVPDPDADKDVDLAARRIETEAASVQIMTVWVAKGLEFPIVLCPTLWRGPGNDPFRYQDESGRRALDLANGQRWPDKEEAAQRKRAAQLEQEGEQLRLLYVALTRARHQAVLWWAPTKGSDRSALARVLFARHADGTLDHDLLRAPSVPLPEHAATADALAPLVERARGTTTVDEVGPARPPADRWVDPTEAEPDGDLALATLHRSLDRRRRRWSFTGITARGESTHFDPVDDSLLDRGAADEEPGEPDGLEAALAPPAETAATETAAAETAAAEAAAEAPATAASPTAEGPEGGIVASSSDRFAALPAGAAFGTLVHTLLEHVDLTVDDLDGALAHELGRALSWQRVDLTPRGVEGATAADGRRLLVEAVRAAVETPLGPLFDGRRLGDVAPGDRLDELGFELLLGEEGPSATDRDVGALILRHLPEPGPLQRWAAGLAAGAFGVDLAGHLTGAIDAVVRVRDETGDGGADRYVVVDYKTNRLSARDEPATLAHYGPEALAEAMAAHHYPLQALLYSVALHRYLRWRVPGYDPSTHLGGIAYLFLRGMTGPDVATTDGKPHGVFAWRPPAALVTDLSDLLAGRVGAAARAEEPAR